MASFVTICELLLEGFLPSLYEALGLYIPLIVVNCIILGRAEAYASKNTVVASLFDGIGMGLGFTIALTLIGIFREILGAGQIFGFQIMPDAYEPITIFILAPGAFFVLAMLIAFQNRFKIGSARINDYTYIYSCSRSSCLNCANTLCAGKGADADETEKGGSAK